MPLNTPKARLIGQSMALGIVASSIATASLCYLGYRQDRARLEAVALELTAESSLPAQKVLTLLHWVNKHGSTARNDAHFVFRRMRATPLQVLDEGGDCADKSRLLAALLREVDIPSTMAMSFDPQSGRPAHTFVEAQIGRQGFMVVDPAFDLYFPKPGQTGYFDLLDLRRDGGILTRRLDQLCAQLPTACGVQGYYLRPAVAYDTASSTNWNRNVFLRILGGGLHLLYGDTIYRYRRPLVLEEPKLLVAALSLIPGGISLAVLCFVAVAGLRRPQRTASSPEHTKALPCVA